MQLQQISYLINIMPKNFSRAFTPDTN